MKDVVFISNLVVEMRIGLHEEERSLAQRVRIDVALETDFREAIRTLTLQHAVDYADVRKKIMAIAAAGEFVLVEEFANRVILCLFENAYVKNITIKISKFLWRKTIPGIILKRSRGDYPELGP